MQLFQQKLEEHKAEILTSVQEKHERILINLLIEKSQLDWRRVGDSFIAVSTGKANFENAAKKCREFHGNARLYEPSTDEHNERVNGLLGQHSYWIGIQKSAEGS